MNTLTYIAILLFILLPFFSETAIYTTHYNQPFIIVIDAGHGGKDSGALGSWVKEKDIALKLALKVGAYLNAYLPDVRVVYTRTKDEFVPLHQRIALANNSNAAVFFSIHCNSLPSNNSSINGTETYVMGLHRATENLEVAKRENKAVLLESDYSNNYGGYDPNSSEGHIMLSMYQNAYLNQSMLLAETLESQFKNNAKRVSRGVKQAGFLVLRTATMPSVLVETGFLSNSSEERYLASEEGQVYMASAMFRALRTYKQSIEEKTNTSFKWVQGNSVPSTSSTNKSYSTKAITTNSKIAQTQPTAVSTIQTGSKAAPKIIEMPSIESMYPSAANTSVKATSTTNSNVVFRVQLSSSPTATNLKSGVWATIKDVECLKIGTTYKCLSGKYNNLKTAVQGQSYWRKNGFKDAFVVAFKNGQKITLEEALK